MPWVLRKVSPKKENILKGIKNCDFNRTIIRKTITIVVKATPWIAVA